MNGKRTQALVGLLLSALCCGLAAVAAGAMVLAGYCDHILKVKDIAPSTIAYLGGNAGLIVAEILLCMVFSSMAAVCLWLPPQMGNIMAWIGISAMGKFFLSGALITYYWRHWYFILDPNGPHAGALALIALSGLQAMSLLLASLQHQQQ